MTAKRPNFILRLLGKLWTMPSNAIARGFELLIEGKDRSEQYSAGDLTADAEWAVDQQQARGSRALLWSSTLIVILLLIWASLGEIDEVVRGEGKVVPSRQVQIVQSLDGGLVDDILVRPGQSVEVGQVLLRIDPTRYSSSLGENRAEWLALTAKAARLEALASGKAFEAPEELLKEAPKVIAMERHIWEARSEELAASLNVAREQLHQRQQELRETQANHDQAAASCSLTSRELRVTQPLLKSGAVSEVDLLRLQRDVARYCGEEKATSAQIQRIGSAVLEANSKLDEIELNFRNQARNELSDTRSKLATLREGQLALADRVKLAEIRSPVRGTVKTLMANTIGGVVQPGKDILDIVPTDDTLLLEARIQPRDIGFLHPGQKAEVKFTAYDFAIYGGLEGKIEQIGADTVTDEKGNAYYVVKVRTDRAYVGNDKRPIIPGMVAEVHILTGKRTVMQYLLKPILRTKANAFTER
ncbi:HlyD family type I secretion periplasmic adaptor subunit [Eoetvoesia caeni]|uniref:Membrane fusion protein (MFP) family protein n=2 Tax=Eoetvoesiella caeni TaxID=645616 RepID=A0A366H4B7_9BURK|nr:HlyD family type I secretion periplasmic adaptor subunit [Eoetvoesiella caeni]MCI2809907.1 HlyD family type I secretion periplasmic adaptor subunit [Eoetvoesiella caeni]NYT55783.1 HlyD family type I secretion periplasmic adaptor subunit [Eoetvoesiella caeni]RBP36441.1 adhesin transport system membrane fusion protein [Eoetvoesiella caeni]